MGGYYLETLQGMAAYQHARDVNENIWEKYFVQASKLSGQQHVGMFLDNTQTRKQRDKKSEQEDADIALLKAFLKGCRPVQPQKRTDYSPKFKTTLCRNYSTVTPGYCPYGESCKCVSMGFR